MKFFLTVIFFLLLPAVALSQPTGLHVNGRHVYDGNGERVVFRGIEHHLRYLEDWNGDLIPEIAQTGANMVRILGVPTATLEGVLHRAIVEHKMFVSIAHVDWSHPTVIETINRYADYITIEIHGEPSHRDEVRWRNEAIGTLHNFRDLGYTSILEFISNGWGQVLSTIINQGGAVFNADPLGKVVFVLQLYSELTNDVSGTLDQIQSFTHPIWVGTCYFGLGIQNGWGNHEYTYREVWDGSYQRDISSLVWAWTPDHEGVGNELTSDGQISNLTHIGRYIVQESPAALQSTVVKTAFLLNAGETDPDPGPFTLTVNSTEGGSVSVSPEQSEYEAGEQVTLTAVPQDGYVFRRWTGALTGQNNPATITMNSNRTVSASFGLPGDLITNGEFSSAAGWGLYIHTEAGAAATGSAADGEYAISITDGGTEEWNVQLHQSGIPLEQGRSYVVSFEARAASPRDIVVNVGQADDPWDSYGTDEFSLTDQRASYSFEFTMAEVFDDNARIEFNCGIESADVFISNVSMVESDAVSLVSKTVSSKPFSVPQIVPSGNFYKLGDPKLFFLIFLLVHQLERHNL